MSRSGPPGHTACERKNQTRVMDQTPTSIGRGASAADLGPEAEAWIEARHAELVAAGRPVSKRFLRQRLIEDWRREERAQDGTAVITFIRHGGEVSRSVPVDAAVGEMVARRTA